MHRKYIMKKTIHFDQSDPSGVLNLREGLFVHPNDNVILCIDIMHIELIESYNPKAT